MSASVFAIDGNTVDATGEITPFDTITLAVSAGGDELIVNSTPTLTLNNGATAAYAGGSGTDELLFVYAPNSGDDIATLGVTQLSGTVIDENSFLPSQISVPATSFIGVDVDTTPPSLTLTGTSADALQGGNPANAASASIADPNGDGTLTGASIAIANLQPGDALGIAGATTGTQMGVSWSYAANTGILVLTGCATLTTYETLLGDLTYQDGGTDDSAAGHPIRTLDWSISEGPLTGSAQTSITIDRPPVLLGTYDLDTVPDGYPTGGSGAALTGDSDPDGDALTITSVSDFRGTMAAGTGIAGAYGELTLDGDGSYSYYAYNTLALDAAPDGAPPVDQFTFTVSDGYGGTAAEDFYVTIDRTPVIASFGINATVTVGGQVTGGAGALLAGDSDPDRYALTITGVRQGFFSAAGGSVLDGNYGQLTVNPDGAYSYTASNTAVINNAQTGAAPVDQFTLSVSDGYGATAAESFNIAVNRPPVLSGGGTVDFVSGNGPVGIEPYFLSLSDPDVAIITGATIAITAGFLAGDTLDFTSQNNITGNYNDATGILSLTGQDTAADYQTALQSISFSSTAADATDGGTDTQRGISVTVTDAASASSAPITAIVDVSPPPPPTISAGATVTYAAGAPPVTLDTALSVTSPNGNVITGATIVTSGGYLAGDTLGFSAQNGITAVLNGATLVLSGIASAGDYQAALDSVSFSSTAADATEDGGDLSRTISYTATDAGGTSNIANSTLTVLAPHIFTVSTEAQLNQAIAYLDSTSPAAPTRSSLPAASPKARMAAITSSSTAKRSARWRTFTPSTSPAACPSRWTATTTR